MALVVDIPEPSRTELRKFGILIGSVVAGLFGLLLPWLFDHGLPTWPWAVGAILGGWALVAPMSLRLVYRGWMRLAQLISRITTPIILGIVFFVTVLPTGLVMRLFRDPLARDLDQEQRTYRINSEKPERNHYESPF